MDRQAWIAVTLCVLGLIGWQVYVTTHPTRLAPAPVAAASPKATSVPSPAASSAPVTTPNGATPAPAAPDQTGTPAPESPPVFEEKLETLANADVELRLTNRGGAISEAHLLHHKADTPQGHVVLDSGQ